MLLIHKNHFLSKDQNKERESAYGNLIVQYIWNLLMEEKCIQIEIYYRTDYFWNLSGQTLHDHFWSFINLITKQVKTSIWLSMEWKQLASVSTNIKQRERENSRKLNHTMDPFKNINIPNEKYNQAEAIIPPNTIFFIKKKNIKKKVKLTHSEGQTSCNTSCRQALSCELQGAKLHDNVWIISERFWKIRQAHDWWWRSPWINKGGSTISTQPHHDK